MSVEQCTCACMHPFWIEKHAKRLGNGYLFHVHVCEFTDLYIFKGSRKKKGPRHTMCASLIQYGCKCLFRLRFVMQGVRVVSLILIKNETFQ